MAERIVSPGVFTRERDLSFLPQAIGELGAAIIGPTSKGPAFVPTQITSFQEYEEVFGPVDNRFYTPYAVQQYLRSAGVVTIVRVLGLGGYTSDLLSLGVGGSSYYGVGGPSGSAIVPSASLAILAPSFGSNGTGDLSASSITGTWDSFTLTVSGSDVTQETYALTFNTSSANHISKVLSSSPQSSKSGNNTSSVYVYKIFEEQAHVTQSYQSAGSGSQFVSASLVVVEDGLDFSSGVSSYDTKGNANTWTGNSDFSVARTPFIQSQLVNGTRYDLFRIYTRSHGTQISRQLKVHILNVKSANDVAGSDFGNFSLQVRVHNPNGTDDDNILEQYDGLTFDKKSPDFFAKRIGDRHTTIDSNGKLTHFGNFPNLSNHIRVGDYEIEGDTISDKPDGVVPMGHGSVIDPSPMPSGSIPAAIFKTTQNNSQGVFDSSVFYGFDFISKGVREQNNSYLSPIPNGATVGNNVTMSLEDFNGNDDASSLGTFHSAGVEKLTLSGSAIGQLKFTVPFQFGFDGQNPATVAKVAQDITANNTQGFDLSTSTSSGSIAYKRAINAVSNPDEFDINLLVTPGVIHRLHPTVTNHAISKVEARADALYIMDSAAYSDSVQSVVDTVSTLDTNYVATYYPWVKIPNLDTAEPVWVPPSVVLPGVISFNDQIAHEWFAPAGLNRGGLTSVLEAATRLTHAERDELYEGRVNPIASFPGQGVVVFGQKTLQSKPSALDRVNVRRLLIALRKFIASASRFLAFEQNSQALRNRFLSIVNPYLEQVQQNAGLSAFRVVMDDTNNTPDVIDRNQLVGQIFIQPTRTAEFIVLDFVVQPTGATFPE
jgi:hypothetical protein